MFIVKTSHSKILFHIGLDQYVYCEYLYCISEILTCALIIPIILMPIHYINSSAMYGLDMFSITTLRSDSDFLYIHAFLTIYLSLVFMYKFYFMLMRFMNVRLEFIQSHFNDLHMRSILVMNIPKELRTDEALLNYIQSLNVGSVESCILVRDMQLLQKLIKKRKYYFNQLELAHIRIYNNIVDALKHDKWQNMFKSCLFKTNNKMSKILRQSTLEDEFELSNHNQSDVNLVDHEQSEIGLESLSLSNITWQSIYSLNRHLVDKFHPIHISNNHRVYLVDHLLNKLQYIDSLIDQYRHFNNLSEFKCTDSAFISFKNVTSQQIICQCTLNNEMIIQPAPQIKDIKWHNLIVRQYNRQFRQFIISAIVLLITVMWFFIMTAVISLTNYQKLVLLFPILQGVSSLYNEYIHQILPTIVVTLCLALLPYLLVGLSWIEKLPSNSQLDLFVTIRYFIFSVFNLIFVFTIGTSLLNTIIDVVLPNGKKDGNNQSVSSILQLLGDNIPQAGYFYINYIVLQLNLHFLELLQLNWALVIKWTTSIGLISNTPRRKRHFNKPWQFLYFYFYPTHALIFMIILVYSIIQPMIILVGFLYFIIGYVVFKHQFMFAYVPKYDSQGKVFQYLFGWGISGILFLQIIMISILLIKDAIIPSILVFLMLLGTIYYAFYSRKLIKKTLHIPLDVLPPLMQDGGSVVTMMSIFERLPVMEHDYFKDDPTSPINGSKLKEMTTLDRQTIEVEEDTRSEDSGNADLKTYIHPLFYKEMSKTMMLPTKENGTIKIEQYLMSWEMLQKQ